MENTHDLKRDYKKRADQSLTLPPRVNLPQLKYFQDTLKDIKERFFTVEEFPHLPRERLPQGVLTQGTGLSGKQLINYALSLKSHELEGLLLDMCEETSSSAIKTGIIIISTRATNRIVKLFNQLWQYNYHKPGIQALAPVLGEAVQKNSWQNGKLLAILLTIKHNDPVLTIAQAIKECDSNISQFNKIFQIQNNSPLAREAYFYFLKNATEPVLKLNKIYLSQVIREVDLEKLVPLITNYLKLFDIDTYEQAVNLSIEKRLGQPYTSSNWGNYDEKLKKKFALWCFWFQLFKHFIHQPKKMKALSPYIGLIRSTEQIPEHPELLIIDFGDLIAVDIADKPYSIFYQDKSLFQKEMADWKKEGTPPQFLNRKIIPVTARDFIIESKEAPCIVMDYDSVNFFYIKEMLDIKMDLEPDMRDLKLFRR